MGCDIHTRVEYLTDDEEWVCGDLFRLNPYYSPRDPGAYDPYSVVEVCDGRNYDLFATLANVRNYGGSAYIDLPRGIPEDACAMTERDYRMWGEDAHSASYFTLKELMDWNRTAPPFKHSGMVSPEDAARLDAGEGTPETWCQWTSQPGWVERTWEEDYKPLDRLIRDLIQRGKDLNLWYDWMDEDQIYERSHQLRYVFWFDN